MARTIAQLEVEVMPAALAYLRRATERQSSVFKVKPAEARTRLLTLHDTLKSTHSDAVQLVFNDWLEQNLAPEGRVRMLAALRRKRADAARGRRKRRTLVLPADTMDALETLAKQAGGMPVTKLLAAFASIGRADEKLRAQILKLAVATGL